MLAAAPGCRGDSPPPDARDARDEAAGWHVLVCMPAAAPAVELMASDGRSVPWWSTPGGPPLVNDPIRPGFLHFRVEAGGAPGSAPPLLRYAAGDDSPSTLQVLAADGGAIGYMLGEGGAPKTGRRLSATSVLKVNMGQPVGEHAQCPPAWPASVPAGRPLVRAWYVPTAATTEKIRQWRADRAAKAREEKAGAPR